MDRQIFGDQGIVDNPQTLRHFVQERNKNVH